MFLGYAPPEHPKAHVPFSSVKQQEPRKFPLTFSSLAFLIFLSLFLNYLFLLVYLIMKLVAYFYGYSLHP